MDEPRWCSRCKQRRTADQFGKDKHGPGGLMTWCRPCRNAYHRNRTKQRREQGIPNDPKRGLRTR